MSRSEFNPLTKAVLQASLICVIAVGGYLALTQSGNQVRQEAMKSQASLPEPPEITQLRQYDRMLRPDVYAANPNPTSTQPTLVTPNPVTHPLPVTPATPSAMPIPVAPEQVRLKAIYDRPVAVEDNRIAWLPPGSSIQVTSTRQNGMALVIFGNITGWVMESDISH